MKIKIPWRHPVCVNPVPWCHILTIKHVIYVCYRLSLLSFKFVEWNKKSKRGILGNIKNLVIPSLLYMIGLLGTSNSSVWGIWYVSFYTYLLPILDRKNDQKHPNRTNYIANILGLCFMSFRYKRIENGAKMVIFWWVVMTFSRVSRPRRSQKYFRSTLLERARNYEINDNFIWCVEEKTEFWKIQRSPNKC